MAICSALYSFLTRIELHGILMAVIADMGAQVSERGYVVSGTLFPKYRGLAFLNHSESCRRQVASLALRSCPRHGVACHDRTQDDPSIYFDFGTGDTVCRIGQPYIGSECRLQNTPSA